MFICGTAKRDLTVYEIGKGMMGYGMHFHVVKGVATPLYVRAFIFRTSTSRIAIAVGELCFYTIALKDAVVKKIQVLHPEWGYTDHTILLTGQHTHCGPGGYSHHLLFNITIPGFRQRIFDHIVDETVAAIIAAESSATEASVYYAEGIMPLENPVAFNRSLHAYNRNPEITIKLKKEEWHLATDRCMRLLRIDTPDGRSMGSINWYGVHTTSMSNDNFFIHFDNKGYAAKYMEQDAVKNGNDEFISAFAQERCGDVSPNYVWDAQKKWTRGSCENDDDSAKENGRYQNELAQLLFEKSVENRALSPVIDAHLIFVNMAYQEIEPAYTGGLPGQMTSPPSHGVSFLEGTKEGPGLPKAGGVMMRITTAAIRFYEHRLLSLFVSESRRAAIKRKYQAQKKKNIMIEAGEGRLAGTTNIKKLIVPGSIDPVIKTFKEIDRQGYTKKLPWVPEIVPLQIIILDTIAWVSFGAEITVIAGKRLEKTVAEVLVKRGINKVILAPYSNGYHGYITTREEYAAGAYEGGHTVYGEWTLAAYQMWFKKLAEEMLLPPSERKLQEGIKAEIFSPDEIWRGEPHQRFQTS